MIKQRSSFAQQIKYRADKICNALVTTENDAMVEKKAPTFWTEEQYEDLFNHGWQ